MENINVILNEFVAYLAQVGTNALNELPRIIGVFLFLGVGWYIAKVLGRTTRRVLRTFNAFLYRRWYARFGTHARLSLTTIGMSGTIVRWTVVFLVFVGAVRIMDIEALSTWLGHATTQLPAVIAGMIIVFIGFVLSKFARDIVELAVRPSTGAQADVFGRLTQVMVMITALVMGLGQAGIDTTLLVSIVTILLAGLFGGMAIAFGFGAKDLVANVIGNHHAQKVLTIGQTVRVGDVQGEIKRFLPTVIVISTAEGQVALPGSSFHNDIIEVIETTETEDE